MPTLDDAPTIPKLTQATTVVADLIQIYDVSTQKPKTITLADLAAFIKALP